MDDSTEKRISVSGNEAITLEVVGNVDGSNQVAGVMFVLAWGREDGTGDNAQAVIRMG
jgi:hypothetical protein